MGQRTKKTTEQTSPRRESIWVDDVVLRNRAEMRSCKNHHLTRHWSYKIKSEAALELRSAMATAESFRTSSLELEVVCRRPMLGDGSYSLPVREGG